MGRLGAESDVAESDFSGAARGVCEGVFTGTHGKEEGADEQVGGVGTDGVKLWVGAEAVGEFMEFAEQSGSDGFLTGWSWVQVVAGGQESPDGWEEPVVEVKGTWLEIVPERRSQRACGSTES